MDNLELARPISVPNDLAGSKPSGCHPSQEAKILSFTLKDGSYEETVTVRKYDIRLTKSDLTFGYFEFEYDCMVNGRQLKFNGYLFQQTGRIYPKEIQGILIRLRNVAIGSYSADALTYPFAEGPRFTMVTSELLITEGLEDALNIDRDSFNTLDPHYQRVQAYVHSFLRTLVFPGSWEEEKARNKKRRQNESFENDRRFVKALSDMSSRDFKSIEFIKRPQESKAESGPPILFDRKHSTIEIDTAHPLIQRVVKRKKYSQLATQVLVAFESVNKERDEEKRRARFYKLIEDIFTS